MGLATTGMIVDSGRADSAASQTSARTQHFNMHGFSAPKLEKVRVGIVGVGERGSGTVVRLASIEGVEIKALCDVVPQRVKSASNLLNQEFTGHDPTAYYENDESWKQVCDRADIDIVYIATPWKLHATIAVYAMERDCTSSKKVGKCGV